MRWIGVALLAAAAAVASPASGAKAPAFFHVVASSPTWSAGGDLAYSQLGPGDTNHPDLVVVDPDRTHRVIARDAYAPQWSPATDAIAFLTNQPGSGNVTELRLVDAAVPAGPALVADNVGSFAWSPRGDQIYVDNGLTCSEIRAVSAYDFTKRRDVVAGAAPLPSPDGAHLAYLSSPEGNCVGGFGTVSVANVDGTQEHVVYSGSAVRFAWSPDGKRLAVESWSPDLREPSSITVVNADGSNPHVIAVGTHPAWSPDGRSIASLSVPVVNAPFPSDEPYLQVVDVASGVERARLLTASAEIHGGPVWSPDGSEIALSRALERGGHAEGLASGLNRLVSLFITPVSDPAEARRVSIAGCELLTPRCTLAGGPGGNVLSGTARRDVIWGYGGDDRIAGGAGNDDIHGGSGSDELTGGAGRDVLSGGSGNDVVLVRDGARDVVYCGSGRDTVIADAVDSVARDCERVIHSP